MPIIKNYGFLWERKHVRIGRGAPAALLGTLNGAKTFRADFKDQIGVYILYDVDRRPIYVGQAGNGNATLLTRLKQHMDDKLWNRWDYFTWLGFRDVTNGGALNAKQNANATISKLSYADAMNEMEGALINVMEPALNKRGGNIKKTADEYRQYVEPELKRITLDDIAKDLEFVKKHIATLRK